MNSWSPSQLNVLKSTLISEERYSIGNLDAREMRLMNVVALADARLTERYPDAAPVIMRIKQANFGVETYNLQAKTIDGIVFDVTVQTEADDLHDVQIHESYFPLGKAEELTSYVISIMNMYGLDQCSALLKGIGTYDTMKYAVDQPLSQFVSEDVCIRVVGDLFVPKNVEIKQGELEKLFYRQGLQGVLYLWFVDEVPDHPDDAWYAEFRQNASDENKIVLMIQKGVE